MGKIGNQYGGESDVARLFGRELPVLNALDDGSFEGPVLNLDSVHRIRRDLTEKGLVLSADGLALSASFLKLEEPLKVLNARLPTGLRGSCRDHGNLLVHQVHDTCGTTSRIPHVCVVYENHYF